MLQHLVEIRQRALRSLIVFTSIFAPCFYFANEIYSIVSKPILNHLPAHTKIIATQVTAPFMVPLRLSFICTLLFCTPYLLYQIWMFVKPGLYKQERKNIFPILILSTLLFYSGVLFAIFLICPLALHFFTNSSPDGVMLMLDIGNYIDFIVNICIASGIAFQIPIVTVVAIRIGLVTRENLISKRRHIIVLAFILGMVLAPPDVISQILLAIPIWALFELGLLLSCIKPVKIMQNTARMSLPEHYNAP